MTRRTHVLPTDPAANPGMPASRTTTIPPPHPRTRRNRDATMSEHRVPSHIEIQAFFDEDTGTLSYVIFAPQSRDAVVIDPYLDYDPVASKIGTESIDRCAHFIRRHELHLHYVLETHAHADHLTGAQELARMFPGSHIAIGARIVEVQETFKPVFNFGETFATDGHQFDLLLTEGQVLQAGTLSVRCLAIPGHTPACTAYLISDALFTGDSLFMPDYGVGRCDFPGGSAEDLYDSIQSKLYLLPDETRVFVGHDYRPGGRELRYQSTIGEEKDRNIHLPRNLDRDAFVEFRRHRDRSLPAPRLMFQSLQFNLNGGVPPAPDNNGVSYLKIPLRS